MGCRTRRPTAIARFCAGMGPLRDVRILSSSANKVSRIVHISPIWGCNFFATRKPSAIRSVNPTVEEIIMLSLVGFCAQSPRYQALRIGLVLCLAVAAYLSAVVA